MLVRPRHEINLARCLIVSLLLCPNGLHAKQIGSEGSPCKDDNDCMFKFVCIRKTCSTKPEVERERNSVDYAESDYRDISKTVSSEEEPKTTPVEQEIMSSDYEADDEDIDEDEEDLAEDEEGQVADPMEDKEEDFEEDSEVEGNPSEDDEIDAGEESEKEEESSSVNSKLDPGSDKTNLNQTNSQETSQDVEDKNKTLNVVIETGTPDKEKQSSETPINTDVPEWFKKEISAGMDRVLGFYKFPKNCKETNFGECDHLISWYNTTKLNEIRFVIVSKGVDSTLLGFSHSTDVNGSDLVTVGPDLVVEDRHMDFKNEAVLDNSRNLINAYAVHDKNHLMLAFTKQIRTDDVLQDVDLATPGGIFLYYNGTSTGKPGEIIIIPKKIDFTPFVTKEKPLDESIVTWKPDTNASISIPTRTSNRLTPINDDKVIAVCSNPASHGQRFIFPSGIFFSEFVTCQSNGSHRRQTCPPGSIFYATIQCCVPKSKFPCNKNCLHLID